ncbi:MAG: hypothetical protein RIQ71_1069 [Verrucomicrobiota bacterium]|jgi:hypothetical protein
MLFFKIGGKRLLSEVENTNLRNIEDQLGGPKVTCVRIESSPKQTPKDVGTSLSLAE